MFKGDNNNKGQLLTTDTSEYRTGTSRQWLPVLVFTLMPDDDTQSNTDIVMFE
jgi:hypothetical protein